MKRLLFSMLCLGVLVSTSASAWTSGGQSEHSRWRRRIIHNGPPRTASPIPEPTAALVFGTALLVIGVSKRRRSDR